MGRRWKQVEPSTVLAGYRVDEEVVRFDRKRLFELELVRWVAHDEVESLQEGDQGELHLLPRKWAALGCRIH